MKEYIIMLELFTSVFAEGMTLQNYLIGAAVATLCGIIAAFTSAFKSQITKSFAVSLIVLPVIVETVILMVNGNVGTGVAVMGAFSLVRFRSVPGKAKEIAAIFLSMTAGLACAAGFIWIALIFTAMVGLLIVAVTAVPLASERCLELRITVPESISFEDAFDDLFSEYAKSCTLINVKTTNMGSLFKLKYRIMLKGNVSKKEFIDKLRCRNGNLEVALGVSAESTETL